jgi:hypothetical protein
MRKLSWFSAALIGCIAVYNTQAHKKPVPVSHSAGMYAARVQSPTIRSPNQAQPSEHADGQYDSDLKSADDEREQSEGDEPSALSSDGHYTSSDGNWIHSPGYLDRAPAGATAQCRDGIYSFSRHHQGTCSRHGGVAAWLD